MSDFKYERFEEGQEVQAIYTQVSCIATGSDCHMIKVVMEKGVGDMVPWFVVLDYNKKVLSIWNGTLLLGVNP